jgi:hypothetical protein
LPFAPFAASREKSGLNKREINHLRQFIRHNAVLSDVSAALATNSGFGFWWLCGLAVNYFPASSQKIRASRLFSIVKELMAQTLGLVAVRKHFGLVLHPPRPQFCLIRLPKST